MKRRFRDILTRIRGSHPWVRIGIGSCLIVFGLLGFLPVLGFWMIPLGLIVLSTDFRWAKRAQINLRLAGRRLRQAVSRR